MEVFDRDLKNRQRTAAFRFEGGDYYDYLRKEAALRLADRLEDINRDFPHALELGAYRGDLLKVLDEQPNIRGEGGIGGIKHLLQGDFIKGYSSAAPEVLTNNFITAEKREIDEENMQFEDDSFDLVVSSLALHWVNDLPSALKKIKNSLKPDGCFVASVLGGNSLKELRHCFYLAEQERKGGLSPHTSPMLRSSDVAALMQAAGFSIPTIDVDTIEISYPDAFTLMEHLSRMGEGSAALNRQYAVGRDTFLSMAALYQDLFGLEDGSVVATFEVVYMIGWKPDSSQPKPCKRGSASKSLKDLSL